MNFDFNQIMASERMFPTSRQENESNGQFFESHMKQNIMILGLTFTLNSSNLKSSNQQEHKNNVDKLEKKRKINK